jgi:hypothetical protein
MNRAANRLTYGFLCIGNWTQDDYIMGVQDLGLVCCDLPSFVCGKREMLAMSSRTKP